jgi:ATP-dependent RNA helicase DDX55/SPB4
MPDLKRFKIEFENADVDKDSIAFKDKAREKQRLENFDSKKAKRQKEIQERKEKWKESLKARKEATKMRNKRKKSRTQDQRAEWEDLAQEMRKIKRVKTGKQQESTISDDEAALMVSSDDE